MPGSAPTPALTASAALGHRTPPSSARSSCGGVHEDPPRAGTTLRRVGTNQDRLEHPNHRHLRSRRAGRGVSVRDDAARHECVLGGLRISGRHHAGTTAGGQGMAGFAISHSCPNGSSTRPTRQPCSRPTADFSKAPASTALA